MKKLRKDVERFYELSGNPKSVTAMRVAFCWLNPRLAPVALIRLSEFFYLKRAVLLSKVCATINVAVFGIEVSPKVEIGGGLFLPHTVGTVIGAAKVGECVTIMQGVTLGSREPDLQFSIASRPVIENHVMIGAGAKVIGNVTIGSHAKVGANAVVVDDIPPHSVAVGVPARVVAQQPVNGAGAG